MTDATMIPAQIDLSTVRTPKTGKMLTDFQVPEKFLSAYSDIVEMLLLSESMNDDERQYWFSLAEVMNEDQTLKLRGILTREREKLAEIEKKYGPKQPTLTDAEIVERNAEMQRKRSEQQAALAAREAEHEKTEDEESILSELDNL